MPPPPPPPNALRKKNKRNTPCKIHHILGICMGGVFYTAHFFYFLRSVLTPTTGSTVPPVHSVFAVLLYCGTRLPLLDLTDALSSSSTTTSAGTATAGANFILKSAVSGAILSPLSWSSCDALGCACGWIGQVYGLSRAGQAKQLRAHALHWSMVCPSWCPWRPDDTKLHLRPPRGHCKALPCSS
jgi:hypothetical protein